MQTQEGASDGELLALSCYSLSGGPKAGQVSGLAPDPT